MAWLCGFYSKFIMRVRGAAIVSPPPPRALTGGSSADFCQHRSETNTEAFNDLMQHSLCKVSLRLSTGYTDISLLARNTCHASVDNLNNLALLVCGYILFHDLDMAKCIQPHPCKIDLHRRLLGLRVGLRIPAFRDPLARLDA